jgi:hypothetical protein
LAQVGFIFQLSAEVEEMSDESPEYILSTLVGLAPGKVTETLKNKELTQSIIEIVHQLKDVSPKR